MRAIITTVLVATILALWGIPFAGGQLSGTPPTNQTQYGYYCGPGNRCGWPTKQDGVQIGCPPVNSCPPINDGGVDAACQKHDMCWECCPGPGGPCGFGEWNGLPYKASYLSLNKDEQARLDHMRKCNEDFCNSLRSLDVFGQASRARLLASTTFHCKPPLVGGAWDIRQTNANGAKYMGTLILHQNGENLSGSVEWQNHSRGSIKNGKVTADRVKFTVTYTGGLEGYYEAKIINGVAMGEGTSNSNKGGGTATWGAEISP
jgi:hypothetical protein